MKMFVFLVYAQFSQECVSQLFSPQILLFSLSRIKFYIYWALLPLLHLSFFVCATTYFVRWYEISVGHFKS